jgi:ribosomal protein S12 methylthiotransferase accessory factor
MSYPMAFGHWHVQQDRLVCRMPRKTVTVTAPGELLGAVVALCDGRMAWKEVAAELAATWSPPCVDAFLSHLTQEGLLVEAGEALACWGELGDVPAALPRSAPPAEVPLLHRHALDRLLPGAASRSVTAPVAASALAAVLHDRESCRTFADRPLSADDLATILWAAHGVTRGSDAGSLQWHRTVASGGHMHSARWFAFVLRELPGSGGAQGTLPGLYEARFHTGGGASLEQLAVDARPAWRLLSDPRVLQFASALVLPVYDVAVPARKYGNRATVFAHIEAGQSLQNAQLMATALGAAGMLRGDTCSRIAAECMGPHWGASSDPEPRWVVMPALVLGAQPGAEEVRRQDSEAWVKVGPASALRPAGYDSRSFAFFAGPIDVGGEQVFASGRSADPRLALRKAQAEAWERQGWAHLGEVIEGTLPDLPGAFDPRRTVAYTREQHRSPGFPLRPFSERQAYLWRRGTDVASGSDILLPAECVHALSALPRRFAQQACANTSTSGVAAWTSREGALCRAVLELVERDAFLRAWLARAEPRQVMLTSLPSKARALLEMLQAMSHRVAISRLPAPVPVYSAFIQATDRPFTAITAAADFDPEAALVKALEEAEGRAAQALAFPAPPVSSPTEVQSTQDVNRFHQTRQFFRSSDFFAAGPADEPFSRHPGTACSTWDALQNILAAEGLKVLAFDLTPAGASVDQGRTPLHVMRAVVPGLFPIWFHHALQPAGLPGYPQDRLTPAESIHPFT